MAEVPPPLDERKTGRQFGALIFVMVVLGGVALTLLARGRWWLPPVATVHGIEIDRLFSTTLIVTGIVFVGVHVLLAAFVWRYGARGGERAAYWHENHTLELTYSLVPAAILVSLVSMGVVVWSRVHAAPPPDAQVLEVRAEQFGWVARYPGPDGIFGRTKPELINTLKNPLGLDPTDPAAADDIVSRDVHMVVNKPIRIRLRSKDVIHSFFVPQFRIRQDVVPGMTIEIWFTPTREGDYEIACSQLCGVGHYIMRGKLKVESQASFDACLAAQKPALTQPTK
jgi:cytochrome c oxidase subunit 2